MARPAGVASLGANILKAATKSGDVAMARMSEFLARQVTRLRDEGTRRHRNFATSNRQEVRLEARRTQAACCKRGDPPWADSSRQFDFSEFLLGPRRTRSQSPVFNRRLMRFANGARRTGLVNCSVGTGREGAVPSARIDEITCAPGGKAQQNDQRCLWRVK